MVAETELSSSVAEAAGLGLSALAQILAGTEDGITVIDAQRRWVYANPAACQMLGRSLDQLRGQDFRESTPAGGVPDDFAGMVISASPALTGQLIDAGGRRREMVYSTFPIGLAGTPPTVAMFHDLTDSRSASRTAAALAQTAAQLVGTASINEILTSIARHAVEGTRALSAGIVVMGDAHRLSLSGGYGPGGSNYGAESPAWIALTGPSGERVIAEMTAGAIALGSFPGKASVLPDAREAWEASDVLGALAETMRDDDWQCAICVHVAWENHVIGVLGVYLPAGVEGPTEAELAFCTALADQAAMAVTNGRLAAEASRAAALTERTRLARDLHDSVSQALFSMTMHARAAELSMQKSGLEADSPLGGSLGQLAELASGTLAEMRALIFALRPEALAEEGLVGALRLQAAALTAREHLPIRVDGPARHLGLSDDVEAHLYRIALEALNNVIKHARSDSAWVTVTVKSGVIQLTVSDDGSGFDPGVDYAGHLGLSTMADRAAVIGANLTIAKRPGTDSGTDVTVTVPSSPSGPPGVA